MLEVCQQRKWELLAAHVRTQHVHVVVQAMVKPEKVLIDLKAYATRALRKHGLLEPSAKPWTEHGSTRYLWKPKDVEGAWNYVLFEQGEPMWRYPNDVRLGSKPYWRTRSADQSEHEA